MFKLSLPTVPQSTLRQMAKRVFFAVWGSVVVTPVFSYTRAYTRTSRPKAVAVTVLAILALASVGTGLIKPAATVAGTNNTINFQARLENLNGAIVADGTYNVEFKLYDASSSGNLLWTESRLNTAGNGVTVRNGYLTANLGSVNAFPSTINWDQDLWITLNIGNTNVSCTPFSGCSPDGEMSPRLKLTGVPYAFRAGQLVGQNGSGTDQVGSAVYVQGGAGTGTGAGGNINLQVAKPAGSTGSGLNTFSTVMTLQGSNGAALFQNAVDSTTAFRVQNAAGTSTVLDVDTTNGRLGIGTAAPTTALEVVGDITSKGTQWTSRTSAADNSWNSVAYGNGLFVAVASSGSGNRVMTSPDGVNWTTQTSAADNAWQSVTYGNGLFVAVSNSGSGNRVMTSPDGVNWTIRNSAANNSWQSVTYGNGLFVAVAYGGGSPVMTSPDGVNWTIRPSPIRQWDAVTYGNGLFVAVAQDGTTDRVMTSPDGITWTSRTTPNIDYWRSVTYGNGLFVAVSENGTGNIVMTSPDGINWTSRTGASTNFWAGVTYGNGLFTAVGYSGTGNRVMTSPDGITWTSRTSAVDNSWVGVTYGNGEFVAVSSDGIGNRVMSSGKSELTVAPFNNTYQGGVKVYGGSQFISDSSSTVALQIQGNNTAGTIGSELANNNFSTSWTGTGWTLGLSSATHASGTTVLSPTTPISVTAGAYYQVSFTVSGMSAGTVYACIGSTCTNTITANTTWTEVLNAFDTANLQFVPSGTFNGTIGSVSVKQVTPSLSVLNVQNSDATTGLEVRSGGKSGVFSNAYLGYQTGQLNTTGSNNVGIGVQTLSSNLNGGYNVGIGYEALKYNVSGGDNIAIGETALQYNVKGGYNIALGYYSLGANVSGNNNVAIGVQALQGNLSGGSNTAIGQYAGETIATGSNNSFLGYQADTSSANLQNSTAIGYRSYVTQNDSLVLGCISGTNGCTTSTKVGIGTSAPGYTLDVVGNINTNTGFLLNGTSINTAGTLSNIAYLNQANTFTSTNLVKATSNTAFQVQDAAGSAAFNIDASNLRVSVGTASLGLNLLNIGSNTTTSAGGIAFGADTNTSTANQNFITGTTTIYGLTTDTSFIYWSNANGSNIGRANLDGTGNNVSFITGRNAPRQLAVDSSFIYWSLGNSANIGRANINGTSPSDTFIATGGSHPSGVAVNASYVYWTDYTTNTIGRANLNGTGPNNSFITGANSPDGMAIDGTYIYWTNSGTNTIGRAKLDGTSVNQSFITVANSAEDIAVDGNYIYWADYTNHTVGRANLDGTNVITTYVNVGTITSAVDLEPGFLYWANRGADKIGRLDLSGISSGTNLYRSAANTLKTDSNFTIQNATNSTTGFQVQNASGTNVLNVDTTNSLTTVRGVNSTATLGSELATGAACSGTNWAGTGPWTHTVGSTVNLSCTPPASVTAGATYQVTFTVTGRTAGLVAANIGAVYAPDTSANVTNITQLITASTTGNLVFTPSTDFDGAISSISVKLVTTTNSVLQVQNSDATVGLEVRSGGSALANTFVGVSSGRSVTTGIWNIGYGGSSLQSNTTGSNNTATGGEALINNTSGSSNTASGYDALYSNVTGSFNTAIGRNALFANTTGDNNTALGYRAGRTSNSANANTTGSGNTFIGYQSGPGTATQLQNATAIGIGSVVSQNDSLVLGCISGTNGCTASTKVGIGTATPTAELDVRGLVNLQPAASLTAGQTHVTQTLTNASSTGGTVNGYSQTLTVSNTVSASTTNGFNLTVTDNTALGNTNTGLKVTLGGSNASQKQIGANIVVNRGVAILAESDGSGGSINCGNTSFTQAAICAYANGGSGAGIVSWSKGSGVALSSYDGSGVYGMSSTVGSAGKFYKGVYGQSSHTGAGAYTDMGVYGSADSGSSATTYGGYFDVTSSNLSTTGAALYATTQAYSATGSGNGINALNVLQAAGGAGQNASATTGVTAGAGAGISLAAGAGGAATGASGANTAGAGGTIAIQGGNGGAATSGTGGAGSGITLTAGNGGNGSTAGGSGGSITLSAGSAGTGGTGTAGSVKVVNAADSTSAFLIQKASAADTLFTADTSINKITIGNSTGTDTNTTLLVVDSATADPTSNLVNGAIFYNSSTNKFRCYQNSAWANCIGSGTGASDLQGAYDGGNTITTTTGGTARDLTVTVAHNATGTDSSFLVNLATSTTGKFAIQNNGADTFSVQGNGDITFSALGSGTIQIGNTTQSVAQTINIGNNATASSVDNITIGNLLGTSFTAIQGGTGSSAVSISTGSSGTIKIGSSGVTTTVQIGNTAGAVSQTINIGNNGTSSSSTALTLGSLIGTSTTTIQAGVNGTNQTLQLQVAASGVIGIGTATSAKTINIGTIGSVNAATTIHIADSIGSSAQIVTIGSTVNASSTTTIQGGTGASAVSIAAGSGGTINVGNSGVANTVQIGTTTGAVAQTINIGNNATASSASNVTIGSLIGSSTTIIQGGTGGINLNAATAINSIAASFAAKADSTTATGPYGVATGDFNGDGKTDAIVTNASSSSASVYINTGSALPTTATSTLTTGAVPVGVATGDFNGDGKTDAIVVNGNSGTGTTASVFINTGSALPTTATSTLTTGTGPVGVATGDFNGDGKTDVIVTNQNSNNASVFINTGSALPTTATSTLTTGTSPQTAAIGDFNGDGKTDVIVPNNGSANASVFINTGSALPTTATSTLTAGAGPISVATGDFNSDGITDAIVINGTSTSSSVYINTGSALPTSASSTITTGTSPRGVATGDFNGDGKLDVVVTNGSATTASVYINNGSALPTAATATLATGTGPRYIATGDFNGDGELDIIVANNSVATASVFINTTPTALAVSGQTAQNGNLTVSGQGIFKSATNSLTAFQIQNASGTSLFNVDTVNSTVSVKSTSTSAFQIQNASGTSLFNVDTSNNNITLLGNNSGETGAWQTASNALPDTLSRQKTFTANGYVYSVGGFNASAAQTAIYYAKLNSDGSVSSWTTASNPLTAARYNGSVATANSYVYIMGGQDSSFAATSTVYYASLNSNGSVGSWKTTTTLPVTLLGQSSVTANGYVYVVGGVNGVAVSTVYYAKLNSDGTLGSWSTAVNALPDTRTDLSTVVANGYIYAIGGDSSGGGASTSTVYYAKLNSDGSVGSWSTNSNALPAARYEHTSVVSNGYVYVIGGVGANSVYYAKLNNDGSTAAWSTSNNNLPGTRKYHSSTIANGYIYTIGGALGTTPQSTVYYASTSRVQVGGNLDLVGLQGQNLADPGSVSLGSTGGSITAGDGNFVGSLQIQGQATFAQGVGILGELNVGGNANITSGSLTVGVAGSTAGSLYLANATSTRMVVLQGLNPSGTGNATIQIPTIAGGSTDTVCLLTLANCSVTQTLQGAYDGGNTITTTTGGTARDLTVTVAHNATGTDSSFLVNLATGTTGKFAIQNNGADQLYYNTTNGLVVNTLSQFNGDLLATKISAGSSTIYTTSNPLSVGNTYYNTGTFQNNPPPTNTMTAGVGVTWTRAMVGGTVRFADGTTDTITNFISSTSLQTANTHSYGAGTTYMIIYGGFNVSSTGTSSLQSTTNSTTAFQVQNAAGNNLVTVDTTNAGVTIGNAGLAGTLQIGNTTGAVAQTINIGNNATASSTNTVTIGNLLSTSATTIQGGTGASAVAIKAGSGGTISIANSGVANTVQIGTTTGAVAQTINIGNNATASSTNNVTIGNLLGASSTIIQSGTGSTTVSNATSSSALITNNTSTGDSLTVQSNGTTVFQLTNASGKEGSALFKDKTDNANAFQIQNSGGTSQFNLDTTTTNLVTNPSFDQGVTGWTTYGSPGTYQQDTTTMYSGLASLKVTTSAVNQGGRATGFSQTISAGTYQLSFWIKAQTSSFSTINIGINTGSDADVCTGKTAQTYWTRVTCSLAPGSTLSSIYIYDSAGSHTFWIDAVQLESGSNATAYKVGSLGIFANINGPTTFRNANDSTAAFQIQNSAGTANLFVADTANSKLGIGQTPTTTGQTLQVTGGINATTGLYTGSGDGTQRIDGSGNLVNIGNLTYTGSPTVTLGGANAIWVLQSSGSTAYLTIDTSSNQKLQVGSSTTDGTAILTVLDSYNTTDPTGVNGAMYYSTNTNTFRCYENGAWKNCTGDTYVYVTGDDAHTNTTLGNISGLSWSAAASTNYRYECSIYFTAGATTNGWLVSATGPTAPTYFAGQAAGPTSLGATGYVVWTANDGGAGLASSGSTSVNVISVNGLLRNSTNSGTVQLRWANELGTSTHTIKQGSYCHYSTF